MPARGADLVADPSSVGDQLQDPAGDRAREPVGALPREGHGRPDRGPGQVRRDDLGGRRRRREPGHQ